MVLRAFWTTLHNEQGLSLKVLLIASDVERDVALVRDMLAQATTCKRSQVKPDDASQAAKTAQTANLFAILNTLSLNL